MVYRVFVEKIVNSEGSYKPKKFLKKPRFNNATVLVVRDGKIIHQNVTLGLRGLGMTEILSGLKSGDHVLTNASKNLADGTRVRLDLQSPLM